MVVGGGWVQQHRIILSLRKLSSSPSEQKGKKITAISLHFGVKAAGDLILEEKCSINTSTELSDTPGNKSLDSYVNIRGEIRSIECPIDQS